MAFVDYILISKVDNVILTEKCKEKSVTNKLEGTLCISSHHLILSSRQKDNLQELWLLHRNIDVIERKANNQGPGGTIILKCKDFRVLHLDIGSTEALYKVAQSVEKLSSLDQTSQYPFFYRPQILSNSKNQKVDESNPSSHTGETFVFPEDEWRISNLNHDFKTCSSYPADLIVPKSIQDEIIVSSANFRDGGRFPILCYYHKGGLLIRSSQPMCGTIGKRCKGDEMLLNSYLRPGKRGHIIDTRSLTSVQHAKTKGGGTEIDSTYPQWLKSHKSVSRPLELTDSLYKLIEACNDLNSSTSQWLSRLDSSKWLSNVQDAMNAACVAAQCLEQEQTAVLVHGGNGRDITLIVTSLVQIILNPKFRTMKGLQNVIKREWLEAGHPFFSRTKHGAYCSNTQNSLHAPTFLLFLDCLHQLNYQFQLSFEFTTEYLIEIFKHAYSSNYGTFLGDSEAERKRLKLADRTYSLWDYLSLPENIKKYTNPLYDPNPNIIWPSVAPVSIVLWRELYLSHTNAAPWNGLKECAIEIKNKHLSIQKVSKEIHSTITEVLQGIELEPNESEKEELPKISTISLNNEKT